MAIGCLAELMVQAPNPLIIGYIGIVTMVVGLALGVVALVKAK